MDFKFLVISNGGVPLFEFPMNKAKLNGIDINSVLFSGLMSAVNTFSLEATGQIIEGIKFGAVQASFSKDGFGNLYILLSNDKVRTNVLKQMHVEIKMLFLNSLDRIRIEIDPEKKTQIEFIADEFVINSIFDPFFRMWSKKIELKNVSV